MSKSFLVTALLGGLLGLSASRPVPPVEPPAAEKAFDLQWGVQIPLRDGVHLNATVYKPRGLGRP